jgi:hypothetical protein
VAFTASVSEDSGPFPQDVYQNAARVKERFNTVVDGVHRTSSKGFSAGPRGNVVSHPVDADGRIVCVCSIDRDVSAGPEPRDVVSGDI